MGGVEENAMGFQHGNEYESTNVSEIAISNVSMANKPHFLASSSAWDPLVSQTFGGSSSMVSHNDFGGNSSYPLVLENQGGIMSSGTSHLVQYMSYGGSGNFSDMVIGSFGQQHGSGGDIVGNNIGGYQPNYGGGGSKDVGNERGVTNCEQSSQIEDSTTEEGAIGSAPPGGNRRKRGLDHHSAFCPDKNAEGDELKDSPGKSSDGGKDHEKKVKVDQNTSADLRGKQLVKQGKDNSQSGEAPKENFIHVRARRGQATNSHSLAERVRREKISERMRLLQELVPGCNKITGKAVMLDEIINYVQSLQQQVEFLSMKLATVNPELNLDVERILSKDILQSRIGHNIGGYGPGISTSHPFPNGNFQGTMAGFPSTSTHFPPMPQGLLDHEFQSFYGMGYDSSTTLDNLGPNGRLKTEL